MLLVTGPAGSGKTARILGEFREALRSKSSLRLLVPTATLSEHLRNELARDGLVVRSKSVSTLAQFTKELAPDIEVVDDGHFTLMVEGAVVRLNRPEFEKVRDLAGVHSQLANTIKGLDAAGCTPRDLARVRRDLAPFRDAIVAVWEDVERQMRTRNKVTRGAQLRSITSSLNSVKLPNHIWLDGFAQLSPPEIDLLCALGSRTNLTLTLPDEGIPQELKHALLARGFREERLHGGRTPEETFVVPETAERETEEIAWRILEAAREGTPFREMGVILRQPAKYLPLLRATFERFGIPAHFYFSDPLAGHTVGRLFSGIVDALLSGWDHEQTLGLLRLMPVIGASNELDKLEIEIRETLPGRGLTGFSGQATGRALHRVIKQLKSLEEWLTSDLTPEEWVANFASLPALFWPGYLDDNLTPEELARRRDQAAGLRAFNEAIQSAASWWTADGTSANLLPLADFWRVAKALIRLTTVTARNRSRNVVHVIHAFEARQWDLSIAFVCGLVEKEFPAQNSRDPFLSDGALNDLHRSGIHARTAVDKDAEEFGLFDAVRTRAREQLVLSHPRLDARGQRTLPSIFLKSRVVGDNVPAVRPALPAHIAQWRQPVSIQSPDLLHVLTDQQTRISVSGLESLLQCPFQFFARRALRVSEMPDRPEDRLSFLVQGNIVHEVLREWFLTRPDMDPLFESVFNRICAKENVPPGFRTERLRRLMLLSLHAFIADTKYPKPRSSETEQSFEYNVSNTLTVTGKLDRIDQFDHDRWAIIDYKFSSAANTKDKVDDASKLQGPLYAFALKKVFDRSPSAMIYASIKDKIGYYGWGVIEGLTLEPMTSDWTDHALERVGSAVAEFRSGVVHPRPMNTGPCRYCDFKDACRVEQAPNVKGAGA